VATLQVPAEASDAQKVERVADEFAQAVVDGDFAAARARLAPWLQRQITKEDLERVLHRELIDGVPPADFTTGGNDSTLADLREHYHEYHHDERGRTFATTTDFGAYGPPSIYIDDA